MDKTTLSRTGPQEYSAALGTNRRFLDESVVVIHPLVSHDSGQKVGPDTDEDELCVYLKCTSLLSPSQSLPAMKLPLTSGMLIQSYISRVAS